MYVFLINGRYNLCPSIKIISKEINKHLFREILVEVKLKKIIFDIIS